MQFDRKNAENSIKTILFARNYWKNKEIPITLWKPMIFTITELSSLSLCSMAV
jgi:hypothetical protein